MAIQERPVEETHALGATTHRSSRSRILVALAVVLALMAGGLVGWTVRGSESGEAASIVLAGEGELTARQEEMVGFLRDYIQAWRDGDAQALEAMYVPNGTFTPLGTEVRTDDGSFADYVGRRSWSSKELLEPILVHGNEVVSFHTTDGDVYMNTARFTTDGELLLVSHEATD